MKKIINPKLFIAFIGALWLSILVYGAIWGERVWINKGAGWDGGHYLNYTKNFHELITNKKLKEYVVSRSLPSAILYYTT
ncbi:MAG: hypothetical protein PF489_04575, partial [Salinivirgaceae bacterium]|nr:hypothetical protein [Salinivirgaceae bacterium]